ncbi:hypothetical protein ES708_24658 [subsurface metagenome]
MPAAVVEFAGVYLIAGVVVGQGSDAEEQVNRRQPGISRDIVEVGPAAAELYLGLGVADIEIGARGAHRAEGARGYHVHFLRRSLGALLAGDIYYLLGGNHHRFAPFYLFIYFVNGFSHIEPL